MTAAYMLKGKRVKPTLSLTISPGSMSVFYELAEHGYIADLIAAGARILECTCGPCIGQGQAPRTGAVSVRTFNRNFKGRSGTADADIYLASVETAVTCALTGEITDPRRLGELREIPMPPTLRMKTALVISPPDEDEAKQVELIHGPNIKPIELKDELPDVLDGQVLIKLKDNISTDAIMPAGIYLALRSNVPEYAKHVFEPVDPGFYQKVKELNGGFIVAGENYGQGSSREHAALCPSHLGIKAVIAKSFARIHMANLVNFGILPLFFKNIEDYEKIDENDRLELDVSLLGKEDLILKNRTKNIDIKLTHSLTSTDIANIKAGGTLAMISRENHKKVN
jgi:aconitate hydratase